MPTFVAVIGSRNSGKSTIIRSLTGCPSGQYRGSVQDGSTGRAIEVIGSSPQEKALSLAQLRAILKRAAQNSACNGVVCALQPTFPRERLSIEDVLAEALAQGFAVHTFILDPEHLGTTGNMNTVKPRLPKGISPPTALDARRFAYLNASIIHARTNIAA